MHSDRWLAQRIRQGDAQAFEEFLDAYGDRVSRLVCRYVARTADAEDIVQEVFIDLYRCIGSYRAEAALSTWVYRVTLNHCLRYRERSRPEGLPYEEALHAEPDWRADPAQAAAREELGERVHNAVDDLSDAQRDVVILHELHGLTYQQCSDLLNVPVGTVKSRLSNAFGRLRQSLGGYVLGEGERISSSPAGERSR